MPRNPEQLLPGIPLLERADLLKKVPSPFSPPWLEPTEIPIHPAVMDSDFLFTPEFAKTVMESLPEAILEDERVMGEVFGKGPFAALYRDESYRENIANVANKIRISVESNLFWVDVINHPNAANIRIDARNGKQASLFSNPNHPMPMVKQLAYRKNVEEPYMYTWLRNNTANVSLVEALGLRNVAIQVNNLGLQRVGQV